MPKSGYGTRVPIGFDTCVHVAEDPLPAGSGGAEVAVIVFALGTEVVRIVDKQLIGKLQR